MLHMWLEMDSQLIAKFVPGSETVFSLSYQPSNLKNLLDHFYEILSAISSIRRRKVRIQAP
jgi:hypothetical protein